MPKIDTTYRSDIEPGTGEKFIPVRNQYSDHAIYIEGVGVGDITLAVQGRGQSEFKTFADNVITEGEMAVIRVGSIDAIRITPANAGVNYAGTVSSF